MRAKPTRDHSTIHVTASNLNWILYGAWGLASEVLRQVDVHVHRQHAHSPAMRAGG